MRQSKPKIHWTFWKSWQNWSCCLSTKATSRTDQSAWYIPCVKPKKLFFGRNQCNTSQRDSTKHKTPLCRRTYGDYRSRSNVFKTKSYPYCESAMEHSARARIHLGMRGSDERKYAQLFSMSHLQVKFCDIILLTGGGCNNYTMPYFDFKKYEYFIKNGLISLTCFI